MGRGSEMERWAEAEVRRLRALPGEQRLVGLLAIADRYGAEGDGDERAKWLRTLMREASSLDRLDWEMRAFGEFRRQHASDGRYAYLRKDILWYFKWLLERLPEYADISAERVEEAFREMEACYAEANEPLKPIYQLRARACIAMGRKEEVPKLLSMWEGEPEGGSDDCPACQADFEIVCHLDNEDAEAALAVFKRMYDGKQWCDETPLTLSRLIVPAMTKGRAGVAKALQKMSERAVRRTPKMLPGLSSHVVYLSMTGAMVRARRLAGVGLARAAATNNDLYRYSMYRAAGFAHAIQVVAKEKNTLPRRLFQPGETGTMEGPEIASASLARSRFFAEKLDRRNGNTRYIDRLNSTEEGIAAMVKAISAKSGTGRA
jgi:hypothetical protein